MSAALLTTLGWLGNACFFSRFLLQWWLSERLGRSVAPPAFWWLSLAGAACLALYTLWAGEPILLLGYAVTLAIYVRNLVLQRTGRGLGSRYLPAVVGLAVAAWALLFALGFERMQQQVTGPLAFLVCGVLGQAVWSSRFLVQWLDAERSGASRFSARFWWTSLVGNALLLVYAIRVGDPIWIAGLALGPLVQVRNLWLSGSGESGQACESA